MFFTDKPSYRIFLSIILATALVSAAENGSTEKNLQSGMGIVSACGIAGGLCMYFIGTQGVAENIERYQQAKNVENMETYHDKARRFQSLKRAGAFVNLASGALLGVSFIWRAVINIKSRVSLYLSPVSAEMTYRF